MRRKYRNEFKYIGTACFDTIEGEGFQTGLMSARRARFLWNAVLKECPNLHSRYLNPRFYDGKKYRLTIIASDESSPFPGEGVLWKTTVPQNIPLKWQQLFKPVDCIKKPIRYANHKHFKIS